MIRATDEDRQELTAVTLSALADALENAPAEAWESPSMCDGWRVREAVAHMTMPARYAEAAFMEMLTAAKFDFTRLSDRLAIEDGRRPIAELTSDLRSETLRAWTPPGGGWTGALNHAVVHSLDVTAALGLAPAAPDHAVVTVLDDLTSGGVHANFGTTIECRRFVATDVDWSFGSGKVTAAPAGNLALVLCGRELPDSEGP